ncbi:BTB/POZ domain-containing adapter for CUL3-mediated RhoA degradation protein 2 [Sciurus carolinensis]|uniref:BTB/POZ domain-containing adapter for CUL3-mediated RhoA degradation protein 2 n=1 Tax=Sciurus carolinensis TaxID=30640 RepID=A0AA41NCA5_SCICA|nr:BTB/POZ domain-containing adapter for CUL3-mediated RhoA degradation protein 2 [Sciurus carolinensis]
MAEPSKPTSCRVVIYLQWEMSGDTCLCPASGAKPKLSSFKGGRLGNKYMQLNVGGSLYYTMVWALTRHDTMLKAMFSGRMEVLTDKEGWILLDRCGKHFGTILNYLRDDTITLPKNRQEIKELMTEAKYYLIQGLVNSEDEEVYELRDHVHRIRVKRYSTYDDRQLGHQSAHRD